MKINVFNGYSDCSPCAARRAQMPYYGAFGALDADTGASYKKFMDSKLDGLRRSLAELRQKRSLTGGYADTATFASLLDRLDGPSRADVMSGSELIEKWAASAQTIAQGMLDQAKLMADADTLVNRLATSIPDIVDTSAMIRKKAGDLGSQYGWVPWVVGGVLVLGLGAGIAWKIKRL